MPALCPFVPFLKEDVEQSIPVRFEQCVIRYPERLAVKTPRYALTYTALNQMANGLAHALLTQAGETSEPVALLLDHDAPAIIAMLGILKAGKCYVPLDPTYPKARLATMLAHAQARVLVTEQAHVSLARSLAAPECQLLDIESTAADAVQDNPGLTLPPSTLAALMYTSGSTGQPKGVMQTHRTMLYRVRVDTNTSRISAEDRLSLLNSCSFSMSIRDIFSALLNGAALFPFSITRDGLGHLASWLVDNAITIYFSVPTVFRHFMSLLKGNEAFPALRLIRLGGEPVTVDDVALYKKHFAEHCLFANALGSNETGTYRQYRLDKTATLPGSIVPVGYALDDKEVMLLDETGTAVGFNRTGEIAVKSQYLSPGYWRQPELTQAAFISDPHAPDLRIFRTGDLGVMAPDGCLTHLGRKDFQVKIRGFRVEVAEVERTLRTYPGVKDVMVTARQQASGDQCLVAYIVCEQQPGPHIGVWRDFVQQRLPDYMVPTAFVLLESLPLTPNGKVDRLRLPEPPPIRPALANAYVAPSTPIETTLVQLWAEVLGLERIGRHDSFLEVGGTSLLAARLVARILDTFAVEVSPSALIGAATVAGVAEMIAASQASQVGEAEIRRMVAEIKGHSTPQGENNEQHPAASC